MELRVVGLIRPACYYSGDPGGRWDKSQGLAADIVDVIRELYNMDLVELLHRLAGDVVTGSGLLVDLLQWIRGRVADLGE